MQTKNKPRILRSITLLILFVLFLIAGVCGGDPAYTFAKESGYSNVLDDLHKDSAFVESQYPANDKDYSLQVIQIAESEDNELFVYVYQPSGAGEYWKATSINISTAINESYSPQNYTLTLLSSNGVFAKYLVDGLTVKADAVRYYDIPSIYRLFLNGYDESPDNITTNEVAYPVAQLWTACTWNGERTYVWERTEVVTLTSQYAGHIYYPDGWSLVQYQSSCDRWFVAFSCDWDIDFLYEADVSYHQTYYYSRDGLGGKDEVTDEGVKSVTLTYDEAGGNEHNSPFGNTYEWKRISSMDEFLNDPSVKDVITDEALERIEGNDWVLSFVETPRRYWYDDYSSSQTWYQISEVTVLRLEFQINETHYNLGVVSNKQSSITPDGGYTPPKGGCTDISWETILMIIGLVLLLIILSPILPYIIQFIVWVISLPFKAIAAIIKAIQKSAKSKPKGNDIQKSLPAAKPKGNNKSK